MSLRLRRLIYLIFILVFFAAAPLVVFYTAGYRYNWQKNKIELTGVLMLNAKPSSTELYLNNVKTNGALPLRLTDLLPNVYFIRAEKQGYFSWQKKLEIKAGQGTLVYDIVLFRQNLPQLAAAGKIAAYSFADGQKLAYLDQNGLWLKNGEPPAQKLADFSPSSPDSVFELEWSPNKQFILLKENSKTENRHFVFDSANPETKPINLENIFPGEFGKVVWPSGKNHLLYAQKEDSFFQIDLNRRKTEKIAAGIKNFVFAENEIYLLKEENGRPAVFKYNSLTPWNKFEKIVDLFPGRYDLAVGRHQYLAAAEKELGSIYLINLKNFQQPILVLKGKFARWGRGEKNDYLAYYDRGEWSIFDPKTKKSQMIGRYSGNLAGVWPVPAIPYYLYQAGDSLYLTELDDRDRRNTVKLISGEEIKKISLDEKGENVYFLNKIGSQEGLWRLKIQ